MINLRDDKELCALFKAESEERLRNIEGALLRLEADPSDRETIEELFRDIHTLKGSAAMVGANDVQAVAHRFEDLLGAAKRGEKVLSAEIVRKLYRSLDVIQKLVDEAVSGTPSRIDVWRVITELRDDRLSAPPEQPPAEQPPAPVESSPAAASPAAAPPDPGIDVQASAGVPVHVPELRQPEPPSAPPVEEPPVPPRPIAPQGAVPTPAVPRAADPTEDWRGEERAPEQREGVADSTVGRRLQIDTIRVEAGRLDALLTHSGELTVARTRLARHLAEIDDLIAIWEESDREGRSARTLLRELRSVLKESHRGAAVIERLAAFQERNDGRRDRFGNRLAALRNGIADEHAKLEFLAQELGEGIRTARLLPLSTVFNLFHRMARDLAREQGKEVVLIAEGGETLADKRILEEVKDPLMHMIRNAVDHGIESLAERARLGKRAIGTIRLHATKSASSIIIEIADDGRGIDLDAIARIALGRGLATREELARMTPLQIQSMIFTPGFSTRALITDVSGRGIGMDVVRANVDRLKGTIAIESAPGVGTTVRLLLPATLATARMLIVGLGGRAYALPVESVQLSLRVAINEIHLVEGRETILLEGRPISIAPLAELLKLPADREALSAARQHSAICVIISDGEERFGVIVDELLDEVEVVLKSEGGLLRRVRNISGSSILGSGQICIILNTYDLVKSIRGRVTPRITFSADEASERSRTILLVEDSITTRTQMKRILESAGYEVVTAVDGVDGFTKAGTRVFDAVISDVQMPHMDGLALTAKLRAEPSLADLPIVLVTSLAREEDKRRGMEVGANAYLTKPTFDQKVLLDTLRRLI